MNRHVMVVDDDIDIREGLHDALTYEGYKVYCASNGQEALDKLIGLDDEDLPGCILLDINMPQMNGREFLIEIEQQQTKLSKIPICVASADRDLSFEDHFHPTEIIAKPFDLYQLVNIVHRFCH